VYKHNDSDVRTDFKKLNAENCLFNKIFFSIF
jgi:hypothetical protein